MERLSIEALTRKFIELPEIINAEVEIELKKVAMAVRDTATKKFGKYQVAVGDLPAWAALKEQTVRRKMAAGSTGDDPLIGHYQKAHEYVSGNNLFMAQGSKNSQWPAHLRNTISIHVENWVAQIGTDDPIGKYHEYGTEHIPPRPYLRPALYENLKFARTSMDLAMQRAIRRI